MAGDYPKAYLYRRIVQAVVFMKPPTKEFYGTGALFKDDSGNWYSLGEK